ncbi:MAG TPA: membrane protein insertase YidC, partial [Gemmatimonadales bacterium]
MERRFLVAVGLMIAVLVVPSFFIKRAPPRRPAVADSAQTANAPAAGSDTSHPAPSAAAAAGPMPSMPAAAFDTSWLTEPVASYRFSTLGATLDRAVFPALKSFNPPDRKAPVQLVRADDRMLAQRLVTGSDTIAFDNVGFTSRGSGPAVEMTGQSHGLTESVTYAEVAGHPYLLDVRGEISGLQGRGALLLVGLGDGFRNVEADSLDNYRSYGVAYRRTSPDNINFRDLNPGITRTIDGPLDWVAVKSKYFIGALLGGDSTRPQLGGAILLGMPKESNTATRMQTWVTMAVGPDGRFHYQFYLGPQTHQSLRPLGRELTKASSYGWIFKPLVMPVAVFFTRLLIWMHEHLHLSYGLALVIFGVMVRLVLWPLNQRAMKSQVAMMAIQPVIKDLQTRYKNDPAKLQ